MREILSAGPVSGMSLFPPERPRGPLSPPDSQFFAPRRPALMRLTAGRGPRHPGTRASDLAAKSSWSGAADHVEPGGWGFTRERPCGAGARGCLSGPARSTSRTGGNFRLCRAGNRGRRLFPKICSPKPLVGCLAGVSASPGPGMYPPQSLRHYLLQRRLKGAATLVAPNS